MKVSTKLHLLLFLLLVAYAVALLGVRQWQSSNIAAFQKNREEEVSRLFDKLMQLRSSSLRSLVTNYTYWDEMVRFVQTVDADWADFHTANAFSTFDVQAVWVFGPDRRRIYFRSKVPDLMPDVLPEQCLTQEFESKHFTHFAIVTPQGLMEVRGATIHPSSDRARKTPSQGFFLVGRLWDRAKLEEFEPLIRGKITLQLIPPSNRDVPSAASDGEALVLTRVLTGWDNQPVAFLRVDIPAPVLGAFFAHSDRNFLLLAILLLVLFSTFGVFLILWVDRPLRRITESLRQENVMPLAKIRGRDNEFAHVATLIRGFFEQKEALVREVAERKRAELASRKNEQRFRKYFELPLIGISVVSPEGRWLEVNDKMCEMLGYGREELTTTTWWDVTAPEDRARQSAMHEKVTRCETEGYTLEQRFIRKSGEIMYGDVSLRCVRKEDGGVDYYVAVVDDITERKRAEEALQFTQFAVEHSAEAMFWVCRDGRMYDANETACRILGYVRDDLLAMRVPDIAPELAEKPWERYWNYARRRRNFTFESSLQAQDGRRFAVEVTVNLLQFKNEEYCFVFARDITERKQAEQERANLEGQLRQAQKMESIGRLAGGVAHDFNNLLSPIIGYADLILSHLDSNDKVYGEVRQILAAAERCGALTRQLLAFSRKQMLNMRVLDINEVVLGFEKMLQRLIGEDIELITIAGKPLAPVKADPSQMEQILMNLAVNGRDAMPHGGRLTIETAMAELDETYARNHTGVLPGRYVLLTIADNGLGMDPEVKSRLFEPFFTTKEHGKGTGLGLATVYGIVKQHGGHIWVYTEPNQGTTFKIYLPAALEDAAALPQSVAQPDFGGSESVLIVEDEVSVRQLVEDVLTTHGYRVYSAANPKEALDVVAASDKGIDLLLTDVILPQMNGKELFERVVSHRPEIKVLYMSGYTGDTIINYGIKHGEFVFLQKPFSVQGLMAKVREALESTS